MLKEPNADKQADLAVHPEIDLADPKLSFGSYVAKVVHRPADNNRLFNLHSFALQALMRHNGFGLLEKHSRFHGIHYPAFLC